jgi:hypothetical protein
MSQKTEYPTVIRCPHGKTLRDLYLTHSAAARNYWPFLFFNLCGEIINKGGGVIGVRRPSMRALMLLDDDGEEFFIKNEYTSPL